MNGILYPRAGTLGGCTAHNALVAIYPYRSDFDYIAGLTGDSSWRAENVREYFVRLEKTLPFSVNDAKRNGPRELIVSVRDAVNEDGSKKYPLDVRMDCFVTKIIFDTSVSPPHATGVEFLDGEYLYTASPLSMKGKSGIPGTATASREVIVAGGIYNSPQLLKLSGIGP
ncbi:hypothetical protein BDV24DRAFT_159447 [Aspergillus arachidicola]|uniref:Glucose-methanol-choline oxidoreductase N-terminal domain-containing protein n=1 Tax=Aspergillus arachidicola TaxID=656916 RepID=A0A5N6YJF4_9EURO|nr:hypothetical protein BDV24DRAFT_159447 [Aspergillus arachidicola]